MTFSNWFFDSIFMLKGAITPQHIKAAQFKLKNLILKKKKKQNGSNSSPHKA